MIIDKYGTLPSGKRHKLLSNWSSSSTWPLDNMQRFKSKMGRAALVQFLPFSRYIPFFSKFHAISASSYGINNKILHV